jgi:Ribonuclease G/E
MTHDGLVAKAHQRLDMVIAAGLEARMKGRPIPCGWLGDVETKNAVHEVLSTLIAEAETVGQQEATRFWSKVANAVCVMADSSECPECDGTGKQIRRLRKFGYSPSMGGGTTGPCPTCHGEGRIRRELAGALWMVEYAVPKRLEHDAKQAAREKWSVRAETPNSMGPSQG